MKHTIPPLSALALLSCFACGAADTDANGELGAAELAALDSYRAAIPKAEHLEVTATDVPTQSMALTGRGNAELAALAIETATQVNFPARAMVMMLQTIVETKPTLFDDEARKFVWGPFDNDDGYGKVLVYIQENEPGADFQYSYAFLRMAQQAEGSESEPVIWGAATPDPERDDRGVGVTLWDFEANHEFEKAHDPAYEADAPRDRGRFAQVYGRGAEKDGELTFNVAVFRDFKPVDAEPGTEAANLDYFFGRFQAADRTRYDFLDWELVADLCDTGADTCFEKQTPDSVAEKLNLRAALVNKRVGRAEATVSGGGLGAPVSLVECWDAALNRTYVGVSEDDVLVIEDGECLAPFDQDLAALGVPTLGDVDPEVLQKLDCVALNGIGGCEN